MDLTISRDEPRVPEHSRAFEKFVLGPDDIVGLLAYALYKSTINERMAAGYGVLASKDRNPQAHEISLHRSQAENYLRAFGDTAIERAKSLLWEESLERLNAGMISQVESSKADIIGAIEKETSFWYPGVAIGVVAWFISLVISLVCYANAPDWAKGVTSHVMEPAAQGQPMNSQGDVPPKPVR